MSHDTTAPDSIVSFRNSQGERGRGTLVGVSRGAVVLEVYNPYSIVQLSEVLTQLEIRRGGRTIYSGRAVVTNLVSTGLMAVVSGSLVDPWSDLAELIPGPELREEVGRFVDDWTSANHRLQATYQVSVSNLRNFLEELSRWLEHSQLRVPQDGPGGEGSRGRAFVEDVDDMVRARMDELLGVFEFEARRLPPEDVPLHKAFCQRELHPLVLCSPFIYRTFTKPLGYAGDYEMVNMMLDDPYQGQTAYARILNTVALRSDTVRAHRNRIEILRQTLSQEEQRVAREGQSFEVLNVGCGPAAEIQQFVTDPRLASRVKVVLVDFNQQTLDYTQSILQSRLRDRSSVELHFQQQSVNDLLKQAARPRGIDGGLYNLVYCAGLFDYLSDRICSKLLQMFYHQLQPGGLVLVTNVHQNQPSRALMEHVQEWNLVLRDERQMRQLVPELGSHELRTDRTGVNLFLYLRKPECDPAC